MRRAEAPSPRVDPGGVRAGSIAQPLWFLAVNIVVVALPPTMIAGHRR